MLNAPAAGGLGGGLGGDDDDGINPNVEGIPPWPCQYRHTKEQIKQLEEFYQEESPYPDKKETDDLATKTGLHPRQVGYWFQNRRSIEKSNGHPASGPDGRTKRSSAYRDSKEASSLNISEGDSNVQATSSNLDSYADNQGISTLPMQTTEIPVAQEVPLVDVATTSTNQLSTQGVATPVLNQAPYQTRPADIPTLPEPIIELLESELSPFMIDVAYNSMSEFLKLAQINEPLWKSSTDAIRNDLDIVTYINMFKKDNYLKANARIEASKKIVIHLKTIECQIYTCAQNKWMQCFPTIVPEAEVIRVEATGIEGNPCGTLQLMSQVIHFLSPLACHRELYFLRYCLQIEQGLWAVVDFSWNPPKERKIVYPIVRKLPSGCLIQGMRNGCTRVTWVEHVEVEDRSLIHPLVRDHIFNGVAFGAGRWISTLQRISERLEFSPATGATNPDNQLAGGIISSDTGRKNLMKLSQMMINNFFASINTSHRQKWSTLSRANDIQVRMSYRDETQPVKADGLIIGAATSTWLPLPPKEVFDFLRKETARPKWDIHSFGYALNEIAYIVNGSEPGNRISVLEAVDQRKGIKMLILQESSTDLSGSLVVHSPISMDVLSSLTTEQDLSQIELLPSGMAIFPAGRLTNRRDGASSSSSRSSAGSLLTLGFQTTLSDLLCEKLDLEAINKARNTLKRNVIRLKSALK
ncbi:hypothetical protein AQUCO_00201197v1 [Aquilegia coerulea]|uniref:Homeobox domain-containing protein n=1 Tax=Aquilegia coerulea TaxID=218851 RepID=A0A2G5F6N9_AQUCA|nr:hypothetical protein AQUCO_00201197v1 [Aquilegia coerulea]